MGTIAASEETCYVAESGSVHMMAALGISTPLQFCGLSSLTGCGADQPRCRAELENLYWSSDGIANGIKSLRGRGEINVGWGFGAGAKGAEEKT